MSVFLTMFQPFLLDAIGAVVALILSYLFLLLRRWLKIDADQKYLTVEAQHREVLHMAIMTGVRLALKRDPQAGLKAAIGLVLDHVRKSVPDALGFLSPADEVLSGLIEKELTSGPGWTRFVSGGSVPPGARLVGEAGPEIEAASPAPLSVAPAPKRKLPKWIKK